MASVILALGTGFAHGESVGRIKVMTFNVLCSFCNPREYDPWIDRLGYFADIFKRHDPDLLGIQELSKPEEVEQIAKLLPNHGAFYYQKGKLAYPDAAIFYRKDRFEVVESGVYWLSPTPDVPMTTGFAGKKMQLARLVVWTVLREIPSGRKLLFVCTHFDPNSPSQELSAPLLLQRTARHGKDLPVIVVGDFNSRPDSKAYAILTKGLDDRIRLADAYEVATTKRTVTNQTSPSPYNPTGRIDHIFVGGPGHWTVHDWAVDLSVYGPKQRHPSDHRPIAAEVGH